MDFGSVSIWKTRDGRKDRCPTFPTRLGKWGVTRNEALYSLRELKRDLLA